MAERGRGRGAPAAGDDPVIRGRGGAFRPAETLNTIPEGVTTTGDNQGGLKIVTNYFMLLTPKDQVVYSYRIDFDPQVENIKVRRSLLYENRQVFDRAYVFDGGNEVKSLSKLPDATTTITANLREGGEVKITIKFTSSVGWGHPEMLRLYNTQMRRNFEHLKFKQVGRDFYNPNFKKTMGEHHLDVWPGLLTAIAEHDGGILMVANHINKLIRHDTAYDVLNRIFKNERENKQAKARYELAGSIVMTKYNNKTYRIDDIAFDKNPTDFTFERREGTISLIAYYRQVHRVDITDAKQPLLLVQPTDRQMRGGDNKEIFLIPELCTMTGLSKAMADDFSFKRALGDITRMDPLQRAHNLSGFIRTVNENETIRTEMSSWGLKFHEKLVELNGTLLPAEKIYTFGENPEGGVLYQQKTGNFEREIRSKKMKKPVDLEFPWALLAMYKDKQIVDDFLDSLRRVSGPLGINIQRPKIFPIESDRTSSYLEICRNVPKNANLVVIVVPNNNAERYSAIKKHFCIEKPIPSQVITSRVIANKKNLMSVATKILIQMSTKLGAEPWSVAIPPKGCMIVGYDTYHDKDRKGYSVGGFVSTSNHTATSWFSRTSYHINRDELCGNFTQNLKAGIKNWVFKNKSWPERIIIYRDGVSEGQIAHVFNVEMKQLQKLLTEKEELKDTAFTFVIVTKRVNARFFHRIGERELTNPPPGCKIDTVVTRKERYDFYLISQSVRQGTVNPTMYNIISDNSGWRAIHHQQLAYKLCHLYYNWAGTITVPAPCQYAHKLAYLTGTALHREHHQDLSDTLFFL